MSIRVFYDNIDYRLVGSRNLIRLIKEVIRNEGKFSGDLSFIFTSDEQLRKINIQFLEHDYYTDVIAFNYNEGNIINGEIYISVDTVRENSINYNVSLKDELTRVMIHGVLHLSGYDDKTEMQKKVMRELEDKWMRLNEK